MGTSAHIYFYWGFLGFDTSYDGSYGLAGEFSDIPFVELFVSEYGDITRVLKVADVLEHFKDEEPSRYALQNLVAVLRMIVAQGGEIVAYRAEADNPGLKESSYPDCIIVTIGD